MKNITIIGTGAYGTALANVLADSNNNVIMYGVVEQQVSDIEINHKNSAFFNDLKINNRIKATTDLASALENAEYIVLGVPTKAIKSVLVEIKKYIKKDAILINTAKGLDEERSDLLSKMIIREMRDCKFLDDYCAIYGPSIAIEVAERKPTYVNVAGHDVDVINEVAKTFSNEYFIVKPNTDLPGCEVSAALKNSIAIACGMLYEMKAGDNAHACLMTLGLQEIHKIAEKFGAKLITFLDFATNGDLTLTCSSVKSRNFTLGRKIVEFGSYEKAQENYGLTVEGVGATKIAHDICEKYAISSPLFDMIFQIIYNGRKPMGLINSVFNK